MTRHAPAEVLAKNLIDNSLASNPEADGEVIADWPVNIGAMLDNPDNLIATYNGPGYTQGRNLRGGTMSSFPGVQVRVRGSDYGVGYQKAWDILQHWDSVARQEVFIEASIYVIHAITRLSDILDLGADQSGRRRNQFTINAVVRIEQLS